MSSNLVKISVLFLVTSLLILGASFISNTNNKTLSPISPINQSVSASQSTIPADHQRQLFQSFGQLNDIKSEQFKENINILLLGLDTRVGKEETHCDAIHMITIKPMEEKVVIYSLPRGTYVPLPSTEKPSMYIANACSVFGVEATVAIIESLLGIKADYKVMLGFSQAQGILRAINLSASETLAFLRNRKYKTGDYQRSHNHAMFIKDAIVNRLAYFVKLPGPVQYLFYSMVETDMDFEMASGLAKFLLDSGIDKNPERIEFKSYSNYKVADIHLDFKKKDESNNDDDQFLSYQKGVEKYLDNILVRAKNYIDRGLVKNAYSEISIPFAQKTWYQIENDNKRNFYHFEFTRLIALTTSDSVKAQEVLKDYIYLAEALDLSEYRDKAEEMLAKMSKG